MANTINQFVQQENERRQAMGLPPLPRRGRKALDQYRKQDIQEYLKEVRGASFSMFPKMSEAERDQYIEKIKQKVLNEIAASSKTKRKKKPKTTDSVVIVDESGTSSTTVEQLQQVATPTVRPSDRMVQPEKPTAGEDGMSLRQRISKFERDVFRTAFPTLSKFIDYVDGKTKQESREKSTEAIQTRRALDRTESMATALNDLALEQNKSVDLLRQLLEAVKGLNLSQTGGGLPNIDVPGRRRGRGRARGRFGGALGRALPFVAGAAAAAAGAYAIGELMETDEDTIQRGEEAIDSGAGGPQVQQQREQGNLNEQLRGMVERGELTREQANAISRQALAGEITQEQAREQATRPPSPPPAERVTREEAARAGVIDRSGALIPLPPEIAALPMSNQIQNDAVKQAMPKPANDAVAADATVVEKTPAGNYNADISQAIGSDLMLKARTIEFKGDEIEFTGQQNALGGMATPTSFAPPAGGGMATPVSTPAAGGMVPSGGQGAMPSAGGAARAPTAGGGGGGTAVSTQVPPEGRALLDAIAQGEGGRHGYNAINYVAARTAGPRFESFERHPFQGQSGYTAAGRYQMLWNTFAPYARRLGLNDFSPESQDRAAWALAQDAYSRATRRNLEEDLRNPQMHGSIAQALAPTWHALQGAGGQRFVATMQQRMQQQPTATPAGGGGEAASVGMQAMAASQENAMAERTPAAPTVVAPAAVAAGMPTPGAAVPATIQSPNDPGPVEPDDAAERYARLFNMAA